MAGTIHDRISVLENKIVALGEAHNEAVRELETLKALAANPAPQVRQNMKEMRMRRYDTIYLKQQLKQKAS